MSTITKTSIITTCCTARDYGYGEDDEALLEVDMTQEVFSLEEAVKNERFLKELEHLGFFHKDIVEENTYLNNFVYELSQSGSAYTRYHNVLEPHFCHVFGMEKVYQEVAGPERLKAVAEYNLKRQSYLDKEKAKVIAKHERKRQKEADKLTNQIQAARALIAKMEKQ